MQQPWWVSIIGVLVGVVIGAVLTYLTQRELQRQRQTHEEHLQDRAALLNRDLEEVYRFIKTDGLRELLGFFKDSASPRELLDRLGKLSAMNEHFTILGRDFQELKGELKSMEVKLDAKLFNPVMARIHGGIEQNHKFASRLSENSASKEFLRIHWLDIETVQHVLASEDAIFIESGSTLAYCMLSIVENIEKLRTSKTPLCVCTNNVAIYMMLLFEKLFNPVLLPGKPGNQYAATFGDIGDDGRHGDGIKRFLEDNGVNVLFTTASYVDIDYGPHVSSVQNHTMKRILIDYANCPDRGRTNICVITAEKVNRDVRDRKISEKCKLIFDLDRTENVLQNQEVLDRTRQAWEAHLHRPNNYIISASSDASECTSQLKELASQHELLPYILPIDPGLLFKMPSI